jgi:hypothetical protein
MANNIDWGEGAINNSIGWGQGALNNDISWGSVYLQSWSGETDIIGSRNQQEILDFIARIAADNGIFEAEQCLINLINNI